ncbi:GDSL esterase/lipase [Quillaja saponaria]|uniref:GDSL esterase/lipase n=1 Tax=Quillaja saponaria TaxID=32244 RepID=A0AAD7LKM1_QUISA|nr:GDSL esterase/lipase [Quillaja saponaria]
MAPTTLFIINVVHLLTITIVNIINARTLNFQSILIFGDSTVDTGNNNYIGTLFKGNHYPYGKDFPGHVPTGRFSNGKLVPDFIASMLNIKETVPPFLDPNLSDEELLTGVSFASGGSGFDDLTTIGSRVIPLSKQIEHFRTYVQRLKRNTGKEEAGKILRNALVVMSSGTNDFIFNFYDVPLRRLEYNISGYQDFLQNRLQIFIKELYDLGCRKIVVAGLPPIGCIPIQMTAKFEHPKDRKCLKNENWDARFYNNKLTNLLNHIQAVLPGSKVVYADVYEPVIDMINQPQNYGFEVTNRGCCGTGLLEAGPLCNAITPICDEASTYLFWDSVHPSEAANQYLAAYVKKEVLPKLLYYV